MEMRDGFGRPDPVTPDLMARRSKLWAHPIVKQSKGSSDQISSVEDEPA
jgi:hypothetical protein